MKKTPAFVHTAMSPVNLDAQDVACTIIVQLIAKDLIGKHTNSIVYKELSKLITLTICAISFSESKKINLFDNL